MTYIYYYIVFYYIILYSILLYYIHIYIYICHIPWLTIDLASLQWLAGEDTGKPRSNDQMDGD